MNALARPLVLRADARFLVETLQHIARRIGEILLARHSAAVSSVLNPRQIELIGLRVDHVHDEPRLEVGDRIDVVTTARPAAPAPP